MRIAILDGFIPRSLASLYRDKPALALAPYEEQVAARADSLIGFGGAYSRNFRLLGHEAQEFYANNPWIQGAWAREHGLPPPPMPSFDAIESRQDVTARLRRALQPYRSLIVPIARRLGFGVSLEEPAKRILRAQIEDFAPDIILNQNIVLVDHELIRSFRKPGRVIIAQHGVGPPEGVDYSVYDFGITMLPYVVEHFRAAGLPAEQVHLAFEPSILERLPPVPEQDLEFTFVGGIEAQYDDRIRMLEAICERYPVHLYLSGVAGLPASSPILRRAHKPVWGREMYRVLQRSRITLNSHIDAAKEFAGNMRLFEATGVGTCLLTDNKSNLSTLFTPGKEVLSYSSIDECLKHVGDLLKDDSRRQEIAHAGQKRTLETHTYRHRAEQILGYVERYAKSGR